MAYTYKPYEESQELKKAQAALASQLARKPGDYRSAWESALKEAMGALLDREAFHYDPGTDPLYRNYRDQAVKNGRLAMLDTLGKSQAMTGGYGNSYAQTAAQQTYDSYLQDLNARIPELYDLALSQYRLQGEALEDRLAFFQDQEDRDYGRWEQTMAQWQAQADLLAGQYSDLSGREYDAWLADRDFDYDRYLDDRDYEMKITQLQQEQSRWEAELQEEQRQFNETQAAKTAAKGSGSYSGNGGYDAATVRKAQEFVGTAVDGMWGKNSKAAAKAMGYGSLKEVLAAMGSTEQKPYAVTDGVAAVEKLAAAGTDQSRLNAYIAQLTAQGVLTSEQAASLRKAHISPKYYY